MSKLSLLVAANTPINPRRVVPIAKHKAARKARENANTTAVRADAFERTGGYCACCLGRRGESMHEYIFKSAFGNKLKAVTRENTGYVCGSGTTKCHGYMQRHEIRTKVVDGVRVFYVNKRMGLTARQVERIERWLEGGYKMFDQRVSGEREARR